MLNQCLIIMELVVIMVFTQKLKKSNLISKVWIPAKDKVSVIYQQSSRILAIKSLNLEAN
jgi:hypothetical protein